MAWNEEGMREVGNSMSVMPLGEGSQEIAISIGVNGVIRVQ